LTSEILLYAAIGFVAQLVDGALGMAFGVISTSVLLLFGVPPAAASASVHAAEVVTTALSGLSHWFHGNVDKRLFWRLAGAGIVGGALGAYVLTELPVKFAQPAVAIYLCAMAGLIVYKAFRKRPVVPVTAGVAPLGFAGGFLDAIGGGGWGPIVVSRPRRARQLPAPHDRHRQPRRVFRDPGDLDRVLLHGGAHLFPHRGGAHPRRRARGAPRRLDDQTLAHAPLDGAGRRRRAHARRDRARAPGHVVGPPELRALCIFCASSPISSARKML
jgi:hypothetical protein